MKRHRSDLSPDRLFCGRRNSVVHFSIGLVLAWGLLLPAAAQDSPAAGKSDVTPAKVVSLHGDAKLWHTLTLDIRGPEAAETDDSPNPFLDFRLEVVWTAPDGTSQTIPGYFAADGDAANSGATSGNIWRVHFAPDQTGTWTYRVRMVQGKHAAIDRTVVGQGIQNVDQQSGSVNVVADDPSKRDPSKRDLRSEGRLEYVGKRYLQFAGSKRYFLKAGADAPETLLGYADFDGTVAMKPKKVPLKTWQPHVGDWQSSDPTWSGGKGKGLIGAINYLSGKGCNAFSFLTYNAGGDGDNVWPFVQRDDKLHYDCSKLDQWGIVFDHGTRKGMYLHFKMQETENDDNRQKNRKRVPESLDGGDLGVERKLYCRELIARFGHNLALNWNLGEENTQTTQQQRAMIDYIADLDAYDHPIVVHTFPDQQDKVYRPLLGDKSNLTGVSLQNSGLNPTHAHTVKWVQASRDAGKPWVVAFDESGSAAHAQCPDLGYEGYDGRDNQGKMTHTQHDVRKKTLWGTLMGGGAGCEYYFGYRYVQNDLLCEDWRSRDQSWDYCRIALAFFRDNEIPFWEMTPADSLVGNPQHRPGKFCLAKTGEVYLVYLADGEACPLDLSGTNGTFRVRWFNPRVGGALQQGSVTAVKGGTKVDLGWPPNRGESDQDGVDPATSDWLALVDRQ